MGLLDTWQEWKNRYSQNKEDRESLQTAGGRPGLRIGMQGYQAPDNAYTGLAPDQRDRLGRVTKERVSVAPLPARDRLGRPYPIDPITKQPITPGTRATALAKKTTPFDPSQGGTSIVGADKEKLDWLGKLTGTNMDKAMATWKEKGGFEGLMANPAFTMGLAFMQASAEGKTIGQGALDNVMKAAGISSHYKKILKDRQEEPIQATAADMAEVESLLSAVNIEEGNWAENLWSKVTSLGKANPKAEWSAAVEEISLKYQEKVKAKQKKLKNAGEPQTLRRSDRLKIMQELIDSGEIEKDEPILRGIFTSGTLKKKLPGMAQGGPVQAGKPYIVGEQGPEVIIPNASGNVLSNDNSQIFAMLLAANPQLQQVSRTRSEKILKSRFPEYFE